MLSKFFIVIIFFHVFFCVKSQPSIAQSWIRAGYHIFSFNYQKFFYPSDINSSLFTHLVCGFAGLDSTSFQVISSSISDEKHFSTFIKTVKLNNPSVITLLSIGYLTTSDYTFSSMISKYSYRKSFIDSSISIARRYGFQGLDLFRLKFNTTSESNMLNLGTLFREWCIAINLEASNASQRQLTLTATVNYSPGRSHSYLVASMQQNLNWVHLKTGDYTKPKISNFTGGHAALYDPNSNVDTDYLIEAWIDGGLSANKLVLGLMYSGYAWTLVNSKDSGIGAAATGPALTKSGYLMYKEVKDYIKRYGAKVMYNATSVVNYCTVNRTFWIGYDDVEAIRTKVSYAKQKGLLGYIVWQAQYNDYNWTLTRAAVQEVRVKVSTPEDDENGHNKLQRRLLVIVVTITAILLGCSMISYS